MTTEEKHLINGSGLFHFRTRLPEEQQLEIVKWYLELPVDYRDKIQTLISEAIDDALFHAPQSY